MKRIVAKKSGAKKVPAQKKHSVKKRVVVVNVLTETDFKGPNVRKRHRKPDEIYGDMSIPDSARQE